MKRDEIIKRDPYIKRKSGDRVGTLTLLEYQGKGAVWSYICDCGYKGVGKIRHKTVCCPKCSRANVAKRATIHGESPSSRKNASRLYGIWVNMKKRCANEKSREYPCYGGRGISVCDEWKNYMVFRNWAYSNGYSDKLSIDRIDNDGNYTPTNCRWATQEEQSRNRRSNRLITYKGITKTIMEWSIEYGINYFTLKSRFNRGFTPEEAFSLEIIKGNNQYLRGKTV